MTIGVNREKERVGTFERLTYVCLSASESQANVFSVLSLNLRVNEKSEEWTDMSTSPLEIDVELHFKRSRSNSAILLIFFKF